MIADSLPESKSGILSYWQGMQFGAIINQDYEISNSWLENLTGFPIFHLLNWCRVRSSASASLARKNLSGFRGRMMFLLCYKQRRILSGIIPFVDECGPRPNPHWITQERKNVIDSFDIWNTISITVRDYYSFFGFVNYTK